MADGDDAADERRLIFAEGDLLDEGAVDLELADGELLQAVEHGVADAKIVDRNPHSQLVQSQQRG